MASYHNLIRDELANSLLAAIDYEGRWIATTEVPVAGRRFDVAALYLYRDTEIARIYEVKTTEADLRGWLSRKGWLGMFGHGAEVWLVAARKIASLVPELDGVRLAVREVDGSLSGHTTDRPRVASPPSRDLAVGMLRALRGRVTNGGLCAHAWSESNDDIVEQESA